MKNRFGDNSFAAPWLSQPTDEPMDDRYREYFQRTLDKSTDFKNRERDLIWWQKYSPSQSTVPVHMMYSDMMPTMVKALNFDTLASGTTTQVTASGFEVFQLDQYNPFLPPAPETIQVIDGGYYENGVLISGATIVYDGGSYLNGAVVPPPSLPSSINGGTY